MTAVEISQEEYWDDVYALPWPSNVQGRVKLFGMAIEETTGAATARGVIFDGNDQTVNTFYPIRLQPNESTADGMFPKGVVFRQGILCVTTSGSIAGMIYVAHLRPGNPA